METISRPHQELTYVSVEFQLAHPPKFLSVFPSGSSRRLSSGPLSPSVEKYLLIALYLKVGGSPFFLLILGFILVIDLEFKFQV